MAKKKREDKNKEILYIKVASMLDLTRYVTRFEAIPGELFLVNDPKKRLVALAHGFDDVALGFYLETKEERKVIRYFYNLVQGEEIEFIDVEDQQPNNLYINIVEMDVSKFGKAKPNKIKKIVNVKLEKTEDLIKSLIRRAIPREIVEHAFAFTYKGKRIVGAFELFEQLDGDKKVFYYSVSKDNKGEGFARYNYSTHALDFSNQFGEHSYMYVKMINLAEPFPFFKE